MRRCYIVHPDPEQTAPVCQFCRESLDPSWVSPPPSPPKPPAVWPLAARLIARLRTDADAGLGDTIARHLSRFGADGFKRVYKKITGVECGCADNQQALNRLFPYQEKP